MEKERLAEGSRVGFKGGCRSCCSSTSQVMGDGISRQTNSKVGSDAFMNLQLIAEDRGIYILTERWLDI
jgi:hypothetical protein